MPKYDYTPVTGTPFEEIVGQTFWDRPDTAKRLRVAGDLGWLVVLNEAHTEIQNLVGFSVEAVNQPGPLRPPRDLAEVAERLGPHGHVLGLPAPFNSDMAAKGLGSKVANTPQALRPSSIQSPEVAVRAVPCSTLDEIYRRDVAEAESGPTYRWLRHGFNLLGAMVQDGVTFSSRGSERATAAMEKDYGNKPLVLMAAPPSWQMEQRRQGIAQPVEPQVMLVRGGRFASQNIMQHLGSYPFAA